MLPGVVSADLNFASGVLLVEYDPARDPREAVIRAVERSGHGIADKGPGCGASAPASAAPQPWMKRHRSTIAVVGSGTLSVLGWALSVLPGAAWFETASIAAYLLAIVAGGWLLLPRAISSARTRSVDMNVLMLTAVAGAVAIGAYSEGAAVVFLFTLGGWLEARALSKTRGSIRALMDLTPPTARVQRREGVVEIALVEARLGDIVHVRPGERIALDGTVTAGVSAVDEAAITGEPLPVSKRSGDHVYAGSLNTSGHLELTVTALVQDSTIARIVYMVEEAQAAKAPVQQLVDRFSRVYTPVVVALAVAVAVVPPLAALALGADAVPFSDSWSVWLYRALVVLVTACPCALVISTPVTLVSAISRAARDGVLVKGGVYLELGARVRAIAFDKTGTLTAGRPTLRRVYAEDGSDSEEILRLAASIEQLSAHPLAFAVLAAAERTGAVLAPVTDFADLPGRGLSGSVEGRHFELVSPTFAEEIAHLPIALSTSIADAESSGMTVLVLVETGVAIGFLGVADAPRPEAHRTVLALRKAGIEHSVMLTGDNERTAAAVASRLGLSGHMARLLPRDKVDAVLRLKERWGTVAMVGDGVNDAPALASADIGIAMGAAGSDTALETADVALMADDLSALPRFFALSKRTLAIIRQNIIFSVAVKVVVLVAAVFGYANMWMAVFADTGVALLVILNGMRLLAGSSPRESAATRGDGEPREDA